MSIKIGDSVPVFSLPATRDKTIHSSDFSGVFTVLYFYPKDNTPGCTTEGNEFSNAFDQFQALNTQIFGVSKDSLRKHENFRQKHDFPFDLISDEDETLCRLFDVIQLKKNYGKEYWGIVRSTFLIDPEGTLIFEWRNVRVKDHVATVLAKVEALQTNNEP